MPGNVITDILGAPLEGIGKAVAAVADAVSGDATKRQAAAAQLQEAQLALQAKLIDADAAFAQAQAQVITADDKSGYWLPANWRPLVMLGMVACLMYDFIIGPLFGLRTVDIPADMWSVIKIGLGGYLTGHTVETIAPHAVNMAAAWKGVNLDDIANASKTNVKVN